MDFITYAHQNADLVLDTPKIKPLYEELTRVINEIDDTEIINEFNAGTPSKSLSLAINRIIKKHLEENGWVKEAPIFQDSEYQGNKWRLDFAKDEIAIEVAFNHGEAIPWNLLKPVLASQLNHVQKAYQAEVGIVICATAELKEAGNFDSAVGEFEKFERYFKPLQNVLNAPILLLGLLAPKTFEIEETMDGRRSIGSVKMK